MSMSFSLGERSLPKVMRPEALTKGLRQMLFETVTGKNLNTSPEVSKPLTTFADKKLGISAGIVGSSIANTTLHKCWNISLPLVK